MQVDGGISRKYGGTVLGLSISKELIILLDRKIKVESQLDKRSIFTVLIKKSLFKIIF